MKTYEEHFNRVMQMTHEAKGQRVRAVPEIHLPLTPQERTRRRIVVGVVSVGTAAVIALSAFGVLLPHRRAPEIASEVPGITSGQVSEPDLSGLTSLPDSQLESRPAGAESSPDSTVSPSSSGSSPDTISAPAAVSTVSPAAGTSSTTSVAKPDGQRVPFYARDLFSCPGSMPNRLFQEGSDARLVDSTQALRQALCRQAAYGTTGQATDGMDYDTLLRQLIDKNKDAISENIRLPYDDAYFADRALILLVLYHDYGDLGENVWSDQVTRVIRRGDQLILSVTSYRSRVVKKELTSFFVFIEVDRRHVQGVSDLQVDVTKAEGDPPMYLFTANKADMRAIPYTLRSFFPLNAIPNLQGLSNHISEGAKAASDREDLLQDLTQQVACTAPFPDYRLPDRYVHTARDLFEQLPYDDAFFADHIVISVPIFYGPGQRGVYHAYKAFGGNGELYIQIICRQQQEPDRSTDYSSETLMLEFKRADLKGIDLDRIRTQVAFVPYDPAQINQYARTAVSSQNIGDGFLDPELEERMAKTDQPVPVTVWLWNESVSRVASSVAGAGADYSKHNLQTIVGDNPLWAKWMEFVPDTWIPTVDTPLSTAIYQALVEKQTQELGISSLKTEIVSRDLSLGYGPNAIIGEVWADLTPAEIERIADSGLVYGILYRGD